MAVKMIMDIYSETQQLAALLLECVSVNATGL